jgi:hypothetical protein
LENIYMKKTLVALAVLAASGASFAQVTLTGEFAYGYLATTNGAGATASGGGIDTGLLTFGAGEDLGGGNRVDIKMSTDSSSGRTGTIGNDDQSISLKTNFATLIAGSTKPGDWLTGATGGGTWYGLDGRVLSTREKNEKVGVVIPFGAFTLGVTAYGPNTITSEGTGNAGTSLQSNTTYNLTYAAGGASVQVGYKGYKNNDGTDATTKSVSRIGGNYDFGMAKLGLGVQNQSLDGGGTNTKTMVSMSAPVGAMSFNAEWVSNKNDVASAAASGTRTGYMLGAQYNLSKRTYGILNYGNWLAALNDSQNSNLTALTLVHDF